MASSATELSRQLRLVLQASPDAPSYEDLLDLLNTFVLECSSSSSPDLLHDFESDLESVYNDVIHYVDVAQPEIFLSVLYSLRPVLPPSSLISTWFDLALRPALREPKLSAPAVLHAKELIIAALDAGPPGADPLPPDAEQDKRKEKVGDFRRRLLDLYLLDAYNESSGDDVLEWAELGADERENKACWKANLEDVLIRAGLERPKDFLTELYHCFVSPSSRLQLLILLNAYTSQPAFLANAPILASHPIMTSLLHSLLFDNSSTLCSVGLSVLTKLLPFFAVKTCEDLKRLLPQLLLVLGRIVCWRERTSPAEDEYTYDFSSLSDRGPEDFDEDGEGNSPGPPIREDIEWERLEQTFVGSASSAPCAHRYFTFLYYLFPCNTIRFMRYPVKYLRDSGFESPYEVDWDDALDEEKIRSKCEPLMRGHVLHPLLIWRGPAEELSQPDFWAQYDVSRIVGDATMLDTRNASLGMRERNANLNILQDDPSTAFVVPASDTSIYPEEIQQILYPPEPVSTSPAASVQGGRPRISLQHMIATSVALKSGLDVDIVDPSPAWSGTLFPQPRTRSPSREADEESVVDRGIADAESIPEREPAPELARGREDVPSRVGQALAGLQREVVLLRNDLNLELWMTRENVRHLGRLYEDRVLSKTAEFERQGLHNKMREYKAEVFRLQKELKDHKEQALTIKGHFADWNRKLQEKLTEFRNEKKAWMVEAAQMRAADKEAKDTFAAQTKLLEEARQAIFQLETKMKENKPKIDRLHDYEAEIDQLIKMQRLWELDVQKLNEQAEYLHAFTSKYRKMELRLQCQEETQADMERYAQNYRQQIRSLESQLAIAHRQIETGNKQSTLRRLSTTEAEFKKLTATNSRLRDENSELREEVEEVQAMMEHLKQQVRDLRAQIAGPHVAESLEAATAEI